MKRDSRKIFTGDEGLKWMIIVLIGHDVMLKLDFFEELEEFGFCVLSWRERGEDRLMLLVVDCFPILLPRRHAFQL